MLIDDLKVKIATLQSLDLSAIPDDQIRELLKVFGKVAVIEYKLHPGKVILRARPEDPLWPYTDRKSLCYKPQEYNKTYQRASTPNMSMFYGSIIPEEIDNGDLDNERIVVTMEASPWLRAKESCGVRRITYSKWEVTSDIKLVAVLQNIDFFEASSHTRKIVKDFNRFIDEHPEYREPSLMVSDYLAHEFGKEETPDHFHYMVSALYSEYLTKCGFDGVLYPSVRVGGQGFNIAITPEAADTKIKLLAAGECTMYKRWFGSSIVDNDTAVIIRDEDQPFTYLPVAPEHHSGEEKCLAHLGVKTLVELCAQERSL